MDPQSDVVVDKVGHLLKQEAPLVDQEYFTNLEVLLHKLKSDL